MTISDILYCCFFFLLLICSVPFLDDHSRVRLMSIDGVPASNYINANFVDVSSKLFTRDKDMYAHT